jgi:hypothetical protein
VISENRGNPNVYERNIKPKNVQRVISTRAKNVKKRKVTFVTPFSANSLALANQVMPAASKFKYAIASTQAQQISNREYAEVESGLMGCN